MVSQRSDNPPLVLSTNAQYRLLTSAWVSTAQLRTSSNDDLPVFPMCGSIRCPSSSPWQNLMCGRTGERQCERGMELKVGRRVRVRVEEKTRVASQRDERLSQ